MAAGGLEMGSFGKTQHEGLKNDAGCCAGGWIEHGGLDAIPGWSGALVGCAVQRNWGLRFFVADGEWVRCCSSVYIADSVFDL